MAHADPARRAAYRRHQRRVVRRYLDGLLAAGRCAVCGEARPPCLEWHHVGGRAAKDFTASTAVRRRMSLARLRAELARCQLLCRNCHALAHASVREVADAA